LIVKEVFKLAADRVRAQGPEFGAQADVLALVDEVVVDLVREDQHAPGPAQGHELLEQLPLATGGRPPSRPAPHGASRASP